MATIGIILAAGRGSRLRQVSDRPKPLALIAGQPLLVNTLWRFTAVGVDRLYLVVRSNVVDYERYLGVYARYCGIPMQVVQLTAESYADSPVNDLLALGKDVGLSETDTLLVSYADIVTDFDAARLLRLRADTRAQMAMLLFLGDAAIYLHKYALQPSGLVLFRNRVSECELIFANGGLFVCAYGLVASCESSRRIAFSLEGGPAWKAHSEGALYGCSAESCYFREVGTPKQFEICAAEIDENDELRNRLFPSELVLP